MLARVWRRLRSRRAASYLLVYLTIFFGIATLIPWGGPESVEVKTWAAEHPMVAPLVSALGMFDPYTTPWFLIPALWLAGSTCACAVERAISCGRTFRSRGRLTASDLTRLERPGVLRFRTPASAEPDTLARVAGVLARRHRMKVRREPSALAAYARTLGLLGSPLFHVSMGLLFVLATAGWLTRAEGGIELIRGVPALEQESSYLSGSRKGVFFLDSYTGYELTLKEVAEAYELDGIVRGSAVTLEVRDNGALVASSDVYSNRPLRLGGTLIHHLKGRIGLAAIVSIEDTVSPQPVIMPIKFRMDANAPVGYAAYEATLTAPGREAIALSVSPERGARLRVVTRRGTEPAITKLLRKGEPYAIPQGPTLEVTDLSRWAEVTVVHDWSIPWLYLMFTLGSIGVALTVFMPYRSVVAGVSDSDPTELRVLVRTQRSDPAFRLRVAEALEADGFERID